LFNENKYQAGKIILKTKMSSPKSALLSEFGWEPIYEFLDRQRVNYFREIYNCYKKVPFFCPNNCSVHFREIVSIRGKIVALLHESMHMDYLSVSRLAIYKSKQNMVFENKQIDTSKLFLFTMHKYVQHAFTYYKMNKWVVSFH
jgi:hypothetical protein